MKINNNKKLKIGKGLIASLFLALIVLLAALEYTNVTNFIPAKPYQTNAPTKEQIEQRQKVESKDKKEFIEDSTTDNTKPSSVPTSSDAISLRTERTGSNELTVFTKLTGYASGKCDLAITNGAKTFSQQADIIYQPEYSVCAGFSVPVSKLGTGDWSIKLTVTASDGSVQTKEITAEVK